eukprot:scaffold277609_cov30-Tisochrysis_lutea.AAC.2
MSDRAPSAIGDGATTHNSTKWPNSSSTTWGTCNARAHCAGVSTLLSGFSLPLPILPDLGCACA